MLPAALFLWVLALAAAVVAAAAESRADYELAQFTRHPTKVRSVLRPQPKRLWDLEDDEEPEMPDGWSSCGGSNDLFQLYAIRLTPDPPKRSQVLRVEVVGHLAEALTEGYMNYTVKLGIIPIVQDTMELCKALEMEPKLPQCPLRAGEWSVTHEADIPMAVPFGPYTIRSVAWTKNGRQIYCVEGTTSMNPFVSRNEPADAAWLDADADEKGQAQEQDEEKEPEEKGEVRWDRQVDFAPDY